jgi:hypothetical protein
MEAHTQLDTLPKLGSAKYQLSLVFKGHTKQGGGAKLGGASAYHLVASCFEDEGPGLKRLGRLWQGMCLPDTPPQTGAWPGPHHPDDDAAVLHCFLVKFYPAFGLCNSSWFYREP